MNSVSIKGKIGRKFMRQNNSQENREDEIKPGDTDPFRVKENGKMYCKVLEGNKFQTWLKLKTIT